MLTRASKVIKMSISNPLAIYSDFNGQFYLFLKLQAYCRAEQMYLHRCHMNDTHIYEDICIAGEMRQLLSLAALI